MKLKTTLLAVKDVERSRRFYEEVFDQKVVFDFGRNVTFSGGFAIQEDFHWLVDLPEESVVQQSHNMELYFVVEDFDAFVEKLEHHGKIKFVHPPTMHEWKQRVVRIYDPDKHIIEIGESMIVVAKRYLKDGYSLEETAEIIQHPIEFIKENL